MNGAELIGRENYRLYLVSKRASRKADEEDVYPGYPPLALVSNNIEFESFLPTKNGQSKSSQKL